MYRFMKYKNIYFALSALVIIPGVIFLAMYGLKPSIDFTGGSVLEVSFDNLNGIDTEKVSNQVSKVNDVKVGSVVNISGKSDYIIKLNNIDEAKKNEILTKLKEIKPEVKESKFETVGPSLGKELLYKTLVAVVLVSFIIVAYIGYQFKNKIFGLAALLAMFHDTLVLLGVFAILGKFYNVEVDTLYVTAVLTTLSFSVHDTIVVFDRIREILRGHQAANLEDAIDKAVNQTLVRSLNNSLTAIFMLTALALLGGVTTKWFVVALLLGTAAGAYSSPFIAAPLLLVLNKIFNKK